ncbi:UNVERIFIED_CONTAM: hypothetical protein FKN15_026103 [Acipenser sinensis]
MDSLPETRNTSTLVVYQVTLLQTLSVNHRPSQHMLEELHLVTDHLLQLSRFNGQALGRGLAALIATQKQLWLSQAQVPDGEKASLLDASVTPGHTFGPAVDELLKRSQQATESSSAGSYEWSNGPPIKEGSLRIGMETSSRRDEHDLGQIRESRDKCLCLPRISPLSLWFSIEENKAPLGVDALTYKWPRALLYTFPPIAVLPMCLKKQTRQGQSTLSCPVMAQENLVFSGVAITVRPPLATASPPRPAKSGTLTHPAYSSGSGP